MGLELGLVGYRSFTENPIPILTDTRKPIREPDSRFLKKSIPISIIPISVSDRNTIIWNSAVGGKNYHFLRKF